MGLETWQLSVTWRFNDDRRQTSFFFQFHNTANFAEWQVPPKLTASLLGVFGWFNNLRVTRSDETVCCGFSWKRRFPLGHTEWDNLPLLGSKTGADPGDMQSTKFAAVIRWISNAETLRGSWTSFPFMTATAFENDQVTPTMLTVLHNFITAHTTSRPITGGGSMVGCLWSRIYGTSLIQTAFVHDHSRGRKPRNQVAKREG